MWTCAKCGEQSEDTFDSCWKCSTPKGAAVIPGEPATKIETPKWKLSYRVFRGVWASWDELFNEAVDFANEIGPERVVNISHSEDRGDGVVAVWYWTTDEKL